jgi:hypothetical protein
MISLSSFHYADFYTNSEKAHENGSFSLLLSLPNVMKYL